MQRSRYGHRYDLARSHRALQHDLLPSSELLMSRLYFEHIVWVPDSQKCSADPSHIRQSMIDNHRRPLCNLKAVALALTLVE